MTGAYREPDSKIQHIKSPRIAEIRSPQFTGFALRTPCCTKVSGSTLSGPLVACRVHVAPCECRFPIKSPLTARNPHSRPHIALAPLLPTSVPERVPGGLRNPGPNAWKWFWRGKAGCDAGERSVGGGGGGRGGDGSPAFRAGGADAAGGLRRLREWRGGKRRGGGASASGADMRQRAGVRATGAGGGAARAAAELGVGRSTPRMLLRSSRHTREARKQRGWRKPIAPMEGWLGRRLAG